VELADGVTFGDYAQFVKTLSSSPGSSYPGTLEGYLRSLLQVVEQHASDTPTYRLLAQVLRDAFTAPALPFALDWLAVTDPPEFLFRFDSECIPPEDPFAALQAMLHYQIADLHRLQEAGKLDYLYRYYGIASSTGHTWYNFDPRTFLECAVASGDSSSSITDCSWEDLIVTL
jgi:hypothetical protein